MAVSRISFISNSVYSSLNSPVVYVHLVPKGAIVNMIGNHSSSIPIFELLYSTGPSTLVFDNKDEHKHFPLHSYFKDLCHNLIDTLQNITMLILVRKMIVISFLS